MDTKNKNSSIIGQYQGKCCDGDVTNSNGMYLSRDLFDTLINSDEYKEALKNGYYIGFLGHPEDPDCQDFKNGCIVMTEMKMKENGDIFGKFNLIDTPVGRIVKAFIDAGVHFGISIRGVGDVAKNGAVDPDSFVFRGFDLVSFPAYADCVPEFQQIAASTDIKKRQAYKKVCASVKKNIQEITSCETINMIRDQFNENSPEYQELDEFSTSLQEQPIDKDQYIELLEQKVEGLTNLLIEKTQENIDIYSQVGEMQEALFCRTREYDRAKQISASQTDTLLSKLDITEKENSSLRRKIKSSQEVTKKLEGQLKHINKVSNENKKLVQANKQLQDKLDTIQVRHEKLNSKVNTLSDTNLLYESEVKAHESVIKDKDSLIKSLQSELDKTVVANERLIKDTSNREDEISELKSVIKANEGIILDYQQAYADMCAYSAGVELDNIKITANTSVSELKSIIYGSASSYQMTQADSVFTEEDIEKDDMDFIVSDDPVIL